MQSLGRQYVYHINHTYRRTGTLWEGRYKASLIDSERYLLTCYRYIELNPVRAQMVAHPEDYRWSSYRAHALGEADPLITDHPEYLAIGDAPKARQHAYRELCRPHLSEKELHGIGTALNQCLVLGSERFKDEVEQQLKRRVRLGKPGRPRKQTEDEASQQ